MENRFKITKIGNVLQSLSNDDALRVIALSLAANDLTLNVEAIGRFSESENMYFFVTSLSILRELAKLVAKIDTSTFQGKISGETKGLLQEVKSSLTSFEKGSLVKDTLKPIRDVTFHYNYIDEKGDSRSLIEQALSEVKMQDTLELGFIENIDSALGQRYIYADKFRSKIVEQLLSKEIVSTITSVSVNVVALVDSLLVDLKKGHE
jgi:hypothetical protein